MLTKSTLKPLLITLIVLIDLALLTQITKLVSATSDFEFYGGITAFVVIIYLNIISINYLKTKKKK